MRNIPANIVPGCLLNRSECGDLCCADATRFGCVLKSKTTLRRFKRDEVLVPEGGILPVVGIVLEGVFRLTQSSPDGRQQIVGLLTRSHMIGRPHSNVSRYAIEAASDVSACVVDRTKFQSLVADHPCLERLFLRLALDELDAARCWAALIGSQKIKERIAAFLLMCRAGAASRIAVPIDRQDMAALLGTTPETISRFVRDLMRRGVIRIVTSREFDLLDETALKAWAGQDLPAERSVSRPLVRAAQLPARTVPARFGMGQRYVRPDAGAPLLQSVPEMVT